jgi:hypothetical protein
MITQIAEIAEINNNVIVVKMSQHNPATPRLVMS